MHRMQERQNRIMVGVRLDPDVVRIARLNRAETGEFVNDFVNRLIREHAARCDIKPKPAA